MKIIVPEATKKGYDEATYGDSINMAYPGSPTRRGRVGHVVAQTLTAGDVQQVVIEPKILDDTYGFENEPREYTETCPTLRADKQGLKVVEPRIAAMRGRNPDNPSDRTEGSPTEQRLEIGSEETSNTLTTVQKDNLVVEPLVWDGFNQQVRADSEVCGTITRNVGADLKRNGQGIIEPTSQYRIRKLTERECFRLMGVKEEDFENVAKNQSTSSLYHLAGDSIVTTCLMAIFGELLDVDYEAKIKELVEELKEQK